MADILMPQLGESVTEGTITRWFKQVGDTVQEDEPLFEVSTDKVDTEVPSPQSGTLVEIRVEEGDTVDVGTVLAVMGDGSEEQSTTQAAPAVDQPTAGQASDGQASDGQASDGQTATEPDPAPGAPVAAPAPQAAPALQAAPAPQADAQAPPAATPPSTTPPAAAPLAQEPIAQGRLLSPLVRRLVEEHQIDPTTIEGTGVGGRITREDVLAVIDARAGGASSFAAVPATPVPTQPALSAPTAPSTLPVAASRAESVVPSRAEPTTSVPQVPAPASQQRRSPVLPDVAPLVPGSGDRVEALNNIRRLTGEAMVASKAAAPHAITIVEVDYEAVERARRVARDDFKEVEGFSLTYLPFISRAVIDALHEFPHMNASMGDGSVVLHDEVHLSIAVDLDYNGLLAPVVRSAHDKRLRAIARDIHELADRARSRTLSPDDLSGGTFTLSNSGSYGTAIVIPIINQPQVAILSTDGVSRKPVVVTDQFGYESIGVHSVGNLTLSWDHRAFDGAYAAAFMARVKEILETRDWEAEL